MLRRLIDTIRSNLVASITAVGVVILGVAASLLLGLPPPFMAALLLAVGFATRGIYRWRIRHIDPRPTTAPLGKLASSGLAAVVAVFLVAQVVPYGRDHSNPPVTGEPAWATPETRDLMVRACFDCHSNEVTWPWYSNIAPGSWATVDHVNEGRDAVNYSEWDRPQDEGDETLEEVKKGSMPPPYYTLFGLHSDAKLTPAEMSTLLDGLSKTPGLSE